MNWAGKASGRGRGLWDGCRHRWAWRVLGVVNGAWPGGSRCVSGGPRGPVLGKGEGTPDPGAPSGTCAGSWAPGEPLWLGGRGPTRDIPQPWVECWRWPERRDHIDGHVLPGGPPEDPRPHGPPSAPDSLGKGGEPSRAVAPVPAGCVGEAVPVSSRRILSSPPSPFPCSRSSAGSRGWAGGKPGLAPSAGHKTAPEPPLSSPNPPRPTPSCCCPQPAGTSIPQTSTFRLLEKPI